MWHEADSAAIPFLPSGRVVLVLVVLVVVALVVVGLVVVTAWGRGGGGLIPNNANLCDDTREEEEKEVSIKMARLGMMTTNNDD